ncbi:hypothetical protein Esti_003840 [Eimeria stiedai]
MSLVSTVLEAAAAASASAEQQQQQQQQQQQLGRSEDSTLPKFMRKRTSSAYRGSNSSAGSHRSSSSNVPAYTDVVIVGAGPTGLSLALSLALQGVSFVLVDAALNPMRDSRAIAVQSRTLEIFEDLGVASSFLLLGNRCRAVELWLSGRRAASVGLQEADEETIPVRVPPLKALASWAGGLGGAAAADTPEPIMGCSSGSPFPFALMIPQATTCQILENKLMELGHQVYRPVAVWQIQGFTTDEPTCFPVQQQQQQDGEGFFSRQDSDGSSFRSPHEFSDELGLETEDHQQQQQQQQQQEQQQQADASAQEDSNGALGYPVTVHFGWYLPRAPTAAATGAAAGAAGAAEADDPPVRFGRIRCRYVVGCDGARSVVRKAGAVSFEGKTNPKTFIVADVRFAPAAAEGAYRDPSISVSSPAPSSLSSVSAGASPAAALDSAGENHLLSRSSSVAAVDPHQQLQQQHERRLPCDLLGCGPNASELGSNAWGSELLTGFTRRLHAAAAAVLEPGETERARLTAMGRRAAAGNAVEIHLTPKGFAACIPMLNPPSREDVAAAAGSRNASRRSSRSSNGGRQQQLVMRRCYSGPTDTAGYRWRVVIERNPEVAAAAAAVAVPREPADAAAAAAAACAAAAEEEAEAPLTFGARNNSRDQSRAELVQQIERVFVGCRVSEIYWSAVYRTGTRVASTFRRQRLLLAGDAAHIQPPILGQGMNLGVQDAYNLAWKLGRVLKQGAAPQLLESYEVEQQQAANQVVRLTDRLFDIVLSASHSSACAAATAGLLPRLLLRVAAPLALHLPGVAKSFSQTLLMTHIAYESPSTALGDADTSFLGVTRPGLRVPDCLVKVARLPRSIVPDPGSGPVAGYLFELLGRGRHLLLLHVMLLPPGARKQNIFGCEIAGSPLVSRYNNEAVSTLARLCQLAVLAAGKSAAGAAAAAAAAAAANTLPFVGDPRSIAAAAAAAGVALVSAAPSLGGPFSAADFADDLPWLDKRGTQEEIDTETEEERGSEDESDLSRTSSRRGSPALPSTPAAAAPAGGGGGSVLRRHTCYPGFGASAAAGGKRAQLWASDLRVVWCLHGPAAAVHTTATANSITSEIVRGNSRFMPPQTKPRSFFLPHQEQQQQQGHVGTASGRWEETEERELVQRPLLQLVPSALLQQMQQASSSSSRGSGGFVLVDFLSDLQTKFGLKLSDPNASDGGDNSGGFTLIRPDGVMAFCGRAGDSKAARGLLDYLIRF